MFSLSSHGNEAWKTQTSNWLQHGPLQSTTGCLCVGVGGMCCDRLSVSTCCLNIAVNLHIYDFVCLRVRTCIPLYTPSRVTALSLNRLLPFPPPPPTLFPFAGPRSTGVYLPLWCCGAHGEALNETRVFEQRRHKHFGDKYNGDRSVRICLRYYLESNVCPTCTARHLPNYVLQYCMELVADCMGLVNVSICLCLRCGSGNQRSTMHTSRLLRSIVDKS